MSLYPSTILDIIVQSTDKVKGNLVPIHAMKANGEVEI